MKIRLDEGRKVRSRVRVCVSLPQDVGAWHSPAGTVHSGGEGAGYSSLWGRGRGTVHSGGYSSLWGRLQGTVHSKGGERGTVHSGRVRETKHVKSTRSHSSLYLPLLIEAIITNFSSDRGAAILTPSTESHGAKLSSPAPPRG